MVHTATSEPQLDGSPVDWRHDKGTAAQPPVDIGVLQVVLSLGIGGTERLVVELCQRLQPRFRMTVCTLDEPGIWAGELTAQGIDVVALNRLPGFHPSLGHRIAKTAKRFHASILHCHHYSPFVYGLLATLMRPSLRLVFTEHGRLSDGPPSRKRRVLNPFLGRLPGALFAVSHALRDSMIDEGFPPGRLGVVHNGIDLGPHPSGLARRALRRTLNCADTTLVIGTIARLDPVKDLGTLIEAFAMLCTTHQDVALIIVGDGEERKRLEDIARRLGVLNQIRFLGQHDDARSLLPAFDVYVNSSISEGVSLTILEAMASALPVVATKVGGTVEVIDNGVTGVLVPARQPFAIAHAVRSLAADPVTRQTIGTAARLAASNQFSIDRMVNHYAQLYLRLAS